MTAYRLSLIPYPIALVLAVGLGIAIYLRTPEPTVYRSTWCPRPEDRTMPGPSLTRDQVLARLREVREKVASLREDGVVDDSAVAYRRMAEIDNRLFSLIADFDLSTTPLVEAKP